MPEGKDDSSGAEIEMRVLITDDDEAVRESLRKVLASAGHEVVAAKNGEEALERLREGGTDLLLLDMEMPKGDGWDVLEELSVRRFEGSVIVITGRADELATRAIAGTDRLLEKPVDVPLLLETVAQVSARRGLGRAGYATGSGECRFANAVTSKENSRGRGGRKEKA